MNYYNKLLLTGFVTTAVMIGFLVGYYYCLLYTSPSPRDS